MVYFDHRSILSNINEIKDYLQRLSFKFDVIVLSETWVNSYDNSDLVGYDLCSKTRKDEGVTMYIRNDMT